MRADWANWSRFSGGSASAQRGNAYLEKSALVLNRILAADGVHGNIVLGFCTRLVCIHRSYQKMHLCEVYAENCGQQGDFW